MMGNACIGSGQAHGYTLRVTATFGISGIGTQQQEKYPGNGPEISNHRHN